MDKKSSVTSTMVSIIPLLSMLIFLQMALFLGERVDKLQVLGQHSIVLYGCAIILFCVLCLVGSIQMIRKNRGEEGKLSDKESTLGISAQKYFFAIVIAIASALWFHAEFLVKKNEFAVGESILFEVLKYKPLLMLFCIFCVCMISFIICYSKKERDITIWLVWITYLFVCTSEFVNKSFFDLSNTLGFVNKSLLDWLKSDSLAGFWQKMLAADPYHGNAYRESIYNVYYNVPYTLETTGVYGHYGLFFKPFMHLFHGNPIALSVLLALAQVLAAICFIYVLHHICSKNWIRCLGALAMGMPAVIWEHRNYWQACPHRILFPLIILAFFTCVAQKDNWSITCHVIAYILGMFAFIWNTETGIFCLAAICIVFAVHYWQHNKWFSPRTWVYEGLLVLASLASAVGGILCVNFYNTACGGEWIWKEYFFPLFENSYMSEVLGYAPPAGNYSWFYILLVFAFLMLYCLNHTSFFCSSSGDKYVPIMTGVSVIGLLNLTYYMNRAAYGNLCITIHFVVLALCYISECFLPDWQQMFRKSCNRGQVYAGSICPLCISILTFCSIITFGVIPKTYATPGRFDTTQLIASAERIRESVPKDTFAIGSGLTELYAINGWDTHAHFRDLPDLMVGGYAALDAVYEETIQHDSFLYLPGFYNEGSVVLDRILAEVPYQLIEEIPIEGGTAYYFAK